MDRLNVHIVDLEAEALVALMYTPAGIAQAIGRLGNCSNDQLRVIAEATRDLLHRQTEVDYSMAADHVGWALSSIGRVYEPRRGWVA